MLGKLLALLLIYTAISIADIPRLKKLDRREIFAYSAVLLLSVYLGITYSFDLKWPFIEDAAAALIGGPARRIIEFLKVPS